MSSPTIDKPVKDWDWNDLRKYCAWQVVQGLLRGDDLMTVMHRVCDITLTWQREQEVKQRAERKKQ